MSESNLSSELKRCETLPFILRGEDAAKAYEHLCGLRKYIEEIRLEYEDAKSEMKLVIEDLSGNEDYKDRIQCLLAHTWNPV